jgi:hypothetical protein
MPCRNWIMGIGANNFLSLLEFTTIGLKLTLVVTQQNYRLKNLQRRMGAARLRQRKIGADEIATT